MAGRFDISLLGDKELSESLAILPANLERTVLTKALKEAAQMVLTAARLGAPRGKTGRLARTLKLKARKRSRNAIGYNIWTGTREQLYGAAMTKISFVDGKVKKGRKGVALSRHAREGYYPAHVHLGVDRGSRHIPANPFLRRALLVNYHYAIRMVAEALRRRLSQGTL